MKNNLCMISYVFGEHYQNYIPLFYFSINKAYPDYDIKVFIDRPLLEHVKMQLSQITESENLEIIEGCFENNSFSKHIAHGAAVRWLLHDYRLDAYKSVYVADIDIFYIRESVDIYTQHMQHCRAINKPFSNVLRIPRDTSKYNIKTFYFNFIKHKRYIIALKHFFYGCEQYQLTGLHFYQVGEYSSKIKSIQGDYIKLINECRLLEHHKNGFNDEALLYDIINEMGYANNLPIAKSNSDMLGSHSKESGFRPHHGLHLGIFRTDKYSEFEHEILNSRIYKEYYKDFLEISETKEFKDIEAFFSPEMKTEFNNMHNYYCIS
ncbi:hypothetical protein AB4438_08125 [Vibrio breoganii]